MDIGGYNAKQVSALGGVINDTYKKVAENIYSKLNQELITPMSTAWYAPEAVEEFKNIDAQVDAMVEDMKEAYRLYANWIQQMGDAWAENTGGQKPTVKFSASVNKNLEYKKIKEKDGNNNVQLDENKAVSVADSMATLRQTLVADTRAYHETLNAASAFIGHGQADAANACFVRVVDAINTLFKLLNVLANTIREYANKYKEVGEKVAAELAAANINVQ